MNEPRCRSAKLGIDGEKRTFVPWITPFNEGLGLSARMRLGAAMNHPKDIADLPTANLAAIAATVADSPILVAVPVHPSAGSLPHGFERADIIILDWIIAASAAHRGWDSLAASTPEATAVPVPCSNSRPRILGAALLLQ
jgi:hypothetical protein